MWPSSAPFKLVLQSTEGSNNMRSVFMATFAVCLFVYFMINILSFQPVQQASYKATHN